MLNMRRGSTMGGIGSYLCMVLIVLTLLMLAGCGGGGSSSLPEAQPYTAEEHAQMETATQIATSAYEAKLASEGMIAAGTAASEAVSQLPGVAATGASADGSTVWIRFADGTEYAIGQLPDMGNVPAGLSTSSRETRDISDFPGDAGSARVLGSDMDNATTAAASCFVQRLAGVGYRLDTSTYRGSNLNPATFYKGVAGAQVVLLAGHGAVLTEAAPYFGAKVVFVTSITDEPQNWDTYSAFLRANEAMFVEFEGVGTRLVITAKYVTDYCSFAPGSMVLGNFCYSDAPYSEWDDAAIAKGAAAFVGWDDKVKVTAAVMTGNGLADLLTGNRADDALGAISSSMMSGISLPSDVSDPEVPMNVGNAKTVLNALGHTGAAGNTARLVVTGDEDWGLRPHLDRYVIGDSKIDLQGYFGSNKGKVFIGSAEQNIISWGVSQITIGIPSNAGNGRTYVQTPQGLKSNVLHISGPLSVFASGPYEVWASNDSPPYQEIEYYDVNTLPGYVKIGAAIGNAQFPSGYRFYVIATPSLIKLDAVRLPNLGYPTHTSNTLGSVFTWGNVHLPWKFDDQDNLIGDVMDYVNDDNIYGKEDGLTDDVGHPEGHGTTGGYYQGFVLVEDPGWIPPETSE